MTAMEGRITMKHLTQKLTRFGLTGLAVAALIPASIFAQSRISPSVIKRSLGAARVNPVKLNSRTPRIPFKPFEMLDPVTGKKVSPDTLITIGKDKSGRVKRATAGQYYEQLNRLERQLNELGYSLRGPDKVVKLQESVINRTKLDQQRQKIKAAHHLLSNTSPPPLTIAALQKQHLMRVNNQAAQLQKLRQFLTAKGYKVAPTKGGMQLVGPFPAQLLHTGIDEIKTWGDSIGSTSDSFSAYYKGKLELKGKIDDLSVHGESSAGGSVLGNEVELLRVSGDVRAALSGMGTAKLDIFILGNSVYNVNRTEDVAWTETRSFSEPYDVNTSATFTIVGIPITTTIGVRGDVGTSYGISLTPQSASANISPGVHSEVYAEAAVDVVIAEGGVGASMTWFNEDLSFVGDLSLGFNSITTETTKANPPKPYLSAGASCHNTIEALSGRIYLFVEINVPFFDDPRYEYDLWNWDGVKASGYLFDERKGIYLF
jgi:hypothetical protein